MTDRCDWATNTILIDYHDNEWGILTFDDLLHFEQLCLSGFQAGLNWELVLKKRDNLREIFSNFNPAEIIKFDEERIRRILQDKNGIRNKKKVYSVINNANRFLKIKKKYSSFSKYIYEYLGNKIIINNYKSWVQIPPFTNASERLSEFLNKQGFSFIGPRIAYAYMQSVGFVDDHIISCFRKKVPLKHGTNHPAY